MLTRWHYIAIAAPLLLFALEWRRNRAIVVSLLFAALLFACTQGMVDLRIRAIRDSVPVGMSSLDPGDPVRRMFGMLHGISMMLMVLQMLIAAITVWMNARKTVFVETDLVPVSVTPAEAAAVGAIPYVPPPPPAVPVNETPRAEIAPAPAPAMAADALVADVEPPAPPTRAEEMMAMSDVVDDDPSCIVVMNSEKQYSIWPVGRELPPGWTDAGFRGPRSACLEWIREHWLDERPSVP